MARERKAKGAGARGAARAAPLRTQEPSLADLTRDQLSVFLYVALTPDETKAIVRELSLSVPGFRTGSLGDVERCDVIADEIRAHPPAASAVQEKLVQAFQGPPLARIELGEEGVNDLLAIGGGDAALALCLWRVLSDRDAGVRQAALPLLDELAAHYFGSKEAAPPPGGRADGDDPALLVETLSAELEEARKRLQEAEERSVARAEEVRRRGEEQREKAQAALRESRARESRAVDEAARAAEAAEAARKEAARQKGEADALRATDAALEAHRARGEAKELAGKLAALEARLERARAREEELVADAERARSERPATQPAERPVPSPEESEATEAETWLFPVYTREFYDSLDRWDRRIQRAAFKQAHLLAQDHRHPSLRALPLEGLPGYYRVRVATDVRLIYRRPERQNTIEILSLIDREDLDRYIRQAKTRG
jgi:mRNA-degrading endonuclease RelE of RelBE toxin-antitoxin system